MAETATSYRCFDVSTTGGVTQLTMNRAAQANSMITEFWSELPEIVEQLDSEGKTRALVLSGEGKHFCSGMDLAVFESALVATDSAADREAFRKLVLKLQHSFSCLEHSRMPVIAAITGACIGAAVDMICACDMRYCTNDAFFTIQEINLGIMADLGTLQRLPKIIPQGLAREFAFTGAKITAQRAKEIGLVNETFESADELKQHVERVAKEIASKSPVAMTASKLALNYARDHGVGEALEHAATLQASVFDREQLLECIRAVKEKRAATFTDLKRVAELTD
jgi:enoyl-CoA hydratase